MKTMTLTEARNQLLKVAEEMERRPDQVVEVVKRGNKVMTLIVCRGAREGAPGTTRRGAECARGSRSFPNPLQG